MQAEDLAKVKREKSREAINFALQSKWAEAVEVNRALLKHFPQDVETHNRLGKALLELGQYGESKTALEKALSLDPRNTIAKKNLERLAALRQAAGASPRRQTRRLTPQLFIEESGKSATVALHTTAPREVLAKVSAGDVVTLRNRNRTLLVESPQGEYLGLVDRRLALRLLPLLAGGNKYEAAIVGIAGGKATVIIREVYRHPSLLGTPSFPLKGTEEYRAYLRGAFLPDDEEGDDDESGEWQDTEEPTAETEAGEDDDVERPPVQVDEDRDEDEE